MKQYEDTNYFITEDGRILNKSKNRFLKLYLNNWGYLWTKLGRKNGNGKQVHRLVAQTYVPNPENKPQVNHIDGNKLNNHYSNLEWVTIQENVQHAHDTGLVKTNMMGNTISRGVNNVKCKLTELQVLEIREKYKTTDYTYKQLAIEYNVYITTINKILRRITWRHI